jgi:hypothetical protein
MCTAILDRELKEEKFRYYGIQNDRSQILETSRTSKKHQRLACEIGLNLEFL